MTTDPSQSLANRIERILRASSPTLKNPNPRQMTALDYAICRAVTMRWLDRPRGLVTEVAAMKDQRNTGGDWLPIYPMGNIVAAVTCDIYHLWR